MLLTELHEIQEVTDGTESQVLTSHQNRITLFQDAEQGLARRALGNRNADTPSST